MTYNNLIKKMTLEEKASLMSGENFWNTKSIDRLNIPSIMLTDGPHGLRKQGGKSDHLGLNKSIPATCFPTAATLANTWDKNLIYEVGKALGDECIKEDVSVLLGPGLNIKRNPLCGRNFEYFSEDPYLTGKLSEYIIKGIQSKGISACPKHYAVNSQEHLRMTIDEIVDKRALHETYLTGFRYAVQNGKAKTIMTSYNKVNGEYANENNYLLKDVLFDKWGFDGVVVTDWGGSNDRVKGLIAGNHLEMPSTGGLTDKEIVDAVKNGEISEQLLDDRVNSLLKLVFSTKEALSNKVNVNYNDQHKKAVESAKRGIVLLKNNNNILPLNKNSKIAVIGDFAKKPRYQGAGSSLINPTKIESPLESLKKSKLNIIGYEKGFKRLGGSSKLLCSRAKKLSKNADIVLLFLGLDEALEAEGIDRKDMSLRNNQLHLTKEILSVNKNVIVVLAGGSPVELPFSKSVKAIVHTYLGGQGVGEAVTQVLTGLYNPSGKLAETYPIKYSDVSSYNYYPGKERTSLHKESIYIGYKYFDTIKKDVLYPFGYGLSYTTFQYSNICVNDNEITFDITNTGKVFGEEVAQLYIKAKNSKIFRAEKELKGFEKVGLRPKETKTVTITLDEYAFSYYNVNIDKWIIEPTTYEILIGSSSKDIKLKSEVIKNEEHVYSTHNDDNFENYYKGHVNNVSDNIFEKLIGYKLPFGNFDKNKNLSYNDTIGQGRHKSFVGKLLYNVVTFTSFILMKMKNPIWSNNMMFILNMPFRNISRFSKGKVNMEMVDGILTMVNDSFFKGLKKYLKAKNKMKKK